MRFKNLFEEIYGHEYSIKDVQKELIKYNISHKFEPKDRTIIVDGYQKFRIILLTSSVEINNSEIKSLGNVMIKRKMKGVNFFKTDASFSIQVKERNKYLIIKKLV